MAFITLIDANITDPAFWAAQDINANSTIDASGISDNFQITITANSITFTDTNTGTSTTYTDTDIGGGAFSNFVEYVGNNNDSNISGATGLNASGYTGGSGNDTLTDDGNLGGALIGNDGDDILRGGTGNNNIFGGEGNDQLFGGEGNNNLTGGIGNDTLFGGTGSGNLQGGEGDDVIIASENTTFIDGGTGNNTLTLPPGATFAPFSPGSVSGTVTMPDGRTYTYLNIQSVGIACFAKGTKISTPNGQKPVENLTRGDLVNTFDGHAKPIKWIGSRTVPATGKHAPIVFEKGAIGNTAKLTVSPLHRILIKDWRTEYLFDETEVLAAAKHLVNGDTIYSSPTKSIAYYHMMFEDHEIVFSEGAPTESFYLGNLTQSATETNVKDEILDIFPELAKHVNTQTIPTVRPTLKGYEAELLNS